MGDATLHRHGDTIPGPDGPPIVPFPRKRAALSAPGGALVLSPLETPLRMRGSGSGERSRGCPLCDPTNAMPANAGTHSGHLGTFSAAGRRFPDFGGSPYRLLLRMGELAASMVNSSLTFFLFHHARRIFFLMSQKENGGCIPTVKPCILVPQSGTMLHPLRRFAAPLCGAKKM